MDALAFLSSNAATIGEAALACSDLAGLVQAAIVVAAFSHLAIDASAEPYAAPVHAGRPHPGQQAVAAAMRGLLAGHTGPGPRIQDPFGYRALPQVHGPALDAIDFCAGLIQRELNAATDNPLVFEDGVMLSGGNFHGQAVAMALDVMAIALTNLATIAERRVDRLVHPDFNQSLPPFLTRDPGVNSGFMMAQVTAEIGRASCRERVLLGV